MKDLASPLIVLGTVAGIVGAFFMLQGLGVIRWPADSFMLADAQWAWNGAVIAVLGLVALLLGRSL